MCDREEIEMATTSKKKTTKKTSTKKTKTTRAKKTTSSRKRTVEDRDDQRIPIQLLVDYRADGHYLFDFCQDVGAGGVVIQTKNPLPQGSTVDLTFTIPDSKETLSTKGEVIWVQSDLGSSESKPGMGVQFNNFSNDQRKTLEDFVARYTALETSKSNEQQSAS